MIRGTLNQIVTEALGLPERVQTQDSGFSGVSIDSRSIRSGNLFVAVKGETHDGHSFVPDALERGAVAAVVRNDYRSPVGVEESRLLRVDDTLTALHGISEWWLSGTDALRIAITGSNGKTTTKEMTAAVLSTKYSTFKSPGNFNNQYGVPLAIFDLDRSVEIAVFEFGMSTPGEIAALTRLVKPQFGLITGIDAAHLETMLTVEAIAEAKFELLDNIASDGTVILNVDNDYLRARYVEETRKKVSFGLHESSDFRPERFELNGTGRVKFEIAGGGLFHLSVPGLHNMYNALGALTVGRMLDVPWDKIKLAVETFQSFSQRMQVIEVGGITIVNDTYNANPASVRYALDTLGSMNVSGRKIAVLGDMLELGDNSAELHHEIGVYVSKICPDMLITCGVDAANIADGAAEGGCPTLFTVHLTAIEEVTDYLVNHLMAGDTVLVKASRGRAFDRIVSSLQSELEGRG
jgi:UDP-N-acetylmuramoyl-tripeptide--D-alanyl-D-alanine ligase